MQRPWISFPNEIHECAGRADFDISRFDGQSAVQHYRHFGIAAQILIAESDLLENEKVSGIEFQCPLKIFHGLVLLALTTNDVTNELGHARIVRQSFSRDL